MCFKLHGRDDGRSASDVCRLVEDDHDLPVVSLGDSSDGACLDLGDSVLLHAFNVNGASRHVMADDAHVLSADHPVGSTIDEGIRATISLVIRDGVECVAHVGESHVVAIASVVAICHHALQTAGVHEVASNSGGSALVSAGGWSGLS